jgi:dTDP-4-dehydrorhamnose 3,5-epimerase
VNIVRTAIPDVVIIEPKVFPDDRGYFYETYQSKNYAQVGISTEFPQDNQSRSMRHVIRGLHYQIQQPQGKLVRVVSGSVFDVAVDIRKSSPTFGKWVGAELSAENKHQFWIPIGFAHGFYVLSEWAEVLYKASDYYAPQWERCIRWNDPHIDIHWPIPEGMHPIVSAKDAQGKLLSEAELFD